MREKLTDYLADRHGEGNVIVKCGGVIIAPDCECDHCRGMG